MKFSHLILFFIFIISFDSYSEQKKFRVHTVGFYNLENLFDTINDTSKRDEASPIMEMKYNRSEVYNKKIQNLSKVIAEIGYEETKALPTIIGLCEVENKKVIEDLIDSELLRGADYAISHFDSPDERGIDVALIYKNKLFEVVNEKSVYLELKYESGKINYTRDQLVVEGILEGEKIYLIVNHWPSRSGGELGSRPYRNKAAQLNMKIIDSIQSIDRNAKIITMGDFNDDPTNESIKKILGSKDSRNNLKNSDLYNPWENLFKSGVGTLVYRDNWNLFDQIIFTGSLVNESKKRLRYYKSEVFSPKYLFNKSGRWKGYPFRSFWGGGFTDGFSDHLPVYVLLVREL